MKKEVVDKMGLITGSIIAYAIYYLYTKLSRKDKVSKEEEHGCDMATRNKLD